MKTYTSAAQRLLLLGAVIRIEALVLPRQSSSSSTRRFCRRPLSSSSPHPYASSPFLVATTKQSSSSSSSSAAAAAPFNRPLTAKKEDDLDDDDDDDEEASRRPGMEDAFRQLNELESLLDDDDDNKPVPPPKKKKIDADTTSSLPDDTIKEVSPEQEIKVYRDMVGELEQNEDAEAYSDIMNELGGKPKQVEDTYSQVMSDLGGTPKPKEVEPPSTLNLGDGDDGDGVGSSASEIDTERFMDSALQEALKEVKVNNPKILGDSILDNKEIMKEIEDIFEEGNEKLLASLEEIRQEQVRSDDPWFLFCCVVVAVVLWSVDSNKSISLTFLSPYVIHVPLLSTTTTTARTCQSQCHSQRPKGRKQHAGRSPATTKRRKEHDDAAAKGGQRNC